MAVASLSHRISCFGRILSDVEIRKRPAKVLRKDSDWRFEHVVVIWCKLLAWRAFSKKQYVA